MILGLFSQAKRHVFFRGLHVGKQFVSPFVEDIILKAIFVNLRQKKWNQLDKLLPSLTSSIVSRVFYENPQVVLELYYRIGWDKHVLDSLDCCGILIRVMVNYRKYDDALCLMKKMMISKGYSPLAILEALVNSEHMVFSSNAVYDSLIRACTQAGATEDAGKVIRKLREEGRRVSVHAWNNFLNHLLKLDEVDQFWMAYKEMVSYGYFENFNTFNLIIYALCKECDLDLALKLIQKIGTMSKGCVSPDIISYNSLIKGYCKSGSTEIAEKFLHEMIDLGIQPNIRTYATLVDGYSANGSLDEAFRLCISMVEKERRTYQEQSNF